MDYRKWWNSMTNDELIKFIEGKFDEYRSLGYRVDHFRSMSAVGTITSNKGFYHELKSIYEMDKFLIQHTRDNKLNELGI